MRKDEHKPRSTQRFGIANLALFEPTDCNQAQMSADTFLSMILEQLATLPDLHSKRMFGGYGLYSNAAFFGIVFDGRLYFKTHPATLAEYLEHQAEVFAPSEKQVLKNYREVPVEILEDACALVAWAKKAAQP